MRYINENNRIMKALETGMPMFLGSRKKEEIFIFGS
jgi:hypothetical protein